MTPKPAKNLLNHEVPPEFAAVAAAFAKDAKVAAGKLMSSYGLKIDGKIFAMFGRGKFVAKLPKQRVDELVSKGMGERFDPGHGRLMKEWIAMSSHNEDWPTLAQEAYRYVKTGKV
jgi:TfoX/Sxy family transcriptional regulator of competence genes